MRDREGAGIVSAEDVRDTTLLITVVGLNVAGIIYAAAGECTAAAIMGVSSAFIVVLWAVAA
jgi:hypothetical protein